MRNRLEVLREAENRASSITRETGTGDELQTTVSNENRKTVWESDISSNSSRTGQRECGNELRNRRRAEHAKAVLDDLCEVVTDLFVAESKLLDPRNYGVPHMFDTAATQYPQVLEREHVLKTVRAFVSSLPLRYALGVETPSEVLLHMRLMAATRTDKTKAVLHIHNLAGGGNWSQFSGAASARESNTLRLVTISCHDATGLLEYISKLLATSGSRVLDADVMLSTDGIVLVCFEVV